MRMLAFTSSSDSSLDSSLESSLKFSCMLGDKYELSAMCKMWKR
jgi:hypothetical protein